MSDTSPTSRADQGAMPHYLTEREAARYTNFAPKTLRNHRTRGTGPAFLRIGRSIRYARPSLDAWMMSNPSAA